MLLVAVAFDVFFRAQFKSVAVDLETECRQIVVVWTIGRHAKLFGQGVDDVRGACEKGGPGVDRDLALP